MTATRRGALGAGVVAVALTGVLATAPTAAAEANPPGCPKGYFCAYSGPNQTGTLLLRVAGNWSGNLGVGSIFNNGVVYPGADHVDVTSYLGGQPSTDCFHYNPGPGRYKANAEPGLTITRVVWRGEC
ncbi:peptidase inhibitor family I36 protein [Streptomyces sp. DSM 41921]|uniref:Peptidase inhibitor family I36 protein n=1 Tax=Streptomyces dubilierae TaxID=3075533 RepID=A0ABU2PFI6_9ACTN|nr:peptidase inhibitor family I36 protein [Streptomyces sp. DSM 41921]MDT0390924.1 peptidase inhibitor family I36 protein [Streptomyces sp. DSM 41921]